MYLAGHLPFKEDMKTLHVGRVGDEFTQEEAEELAKVTGLELISSLKTVVGDLDKVPPPAPPQYAASSDRPFYPQVKRVVKVNGYIACVPGFNAVPAVLNGCSNLMGEVHAEICAEICAAAGGVALRARSPPTARIARRSSRIAASTRALRLAWSRSRSACPSRSI